MGKRRLVFFAAFATLTTAALLLLVRQCQPSAAIRPDEPARLSATTSAVFAKPSAQQPVRANAVSKLAHRPAPEIASRNDRRSGLAWILRQLGASEELLDRMTDGDLVASINELKRQAAKGDASAVNILGFIAYQKCYLGRNEEQVSSYEAGQLEQARSLSPNDMQWFTAVIKQDGDFDRQFASACAQLIDQEQVSSWVEALAAQGNAASMWLLSRGAGNLANMQKDLRDAAVAGFPQAQFDLAWAILAGQEGAAGSGPQTISAVAMLRQASDHLPSAEAQLALCEYSGCEGAAPDIDSAVKHARDAAKQGTIDALIAMGPHLSPSQINPDELAAWNLVHAGLQQNGCSVSILNVPWIKSTTATLADTRVSANAHWLADQYWQDYGTQMMTALGCAG